MKNLFALCLVTALIVFSCSYNKYELPAPVVTEDTPSEVVVSYTSFTKRMIDNNHCLECHSGPSPAAGRDYSTYNGIKDVANNGLLKLRAIDGGAPTMPLGYPELAQPIKDTLQMWIDQGAIE